MALKTECVAEKASKQNTQVVTEADRGFAVDTLHMEARVNTHGRAETQMCYSDCMAVACYY